ncbi:MAG: hypothetical protein ACE5HO_11185 [bacterium]
MSPEQAPGTNVDHRSDIWALGLVMYEMVTGKQRFRSLLPRLAYRARPFIYIFLFCRGPTSSS